MRFPFNCHNLSGAFKPPIVSQAHYSRQAQFFFHFKEKKERIGGVNGTVISRGERQLNKRANNPAGKGAAKLSLFQHVSQWLPL